MALLKEYQTTIAHFGEVVKPKGTSMEDLTLSGLLCLHLKIISKEIHVQYKKTGVRSD